MRFIRSFPVFLIAIALIFALFLPFSWAGEPMPEIPGITAEGSDCVIVLCPVLATEEALTLLGIDVAGTVPEYRSMPGDLLSILQGNESKHIPLTQTLTEDVNIPNYILKSGYYLNNYKRRAMLSTERKYE